MYSAKPSYFKRAIDTGKSCLTCSILYILTPFYPAIAPSISQISYQRNQSYMIMITVPNEYKCMYPLFKCIVAVCMGIFTL